VPVSATTDHLTLKTADCSFICFRRMLIPNHAARLSLVSWLLQSDHGITFVHSKAYHTNDSPTGDLLHFLFDELFIQENLVMCIVISSDSLLSVRASFDLIKYCSLTYER
jgi:hypothetical protein